MVVKKLLRLGAKINIKNNDGWTPLHAAVKKNHEQIVYHLLKSGASKDVKSINGETASDLARSLGKTDFLHFSIYNLNLCCQ